MSGIFICLIEFDLFIFILNVSLEKDNSKKCEFYFYGSAANLLLWVCSPWLLMKKNSRKSIINSSKEKILKTDLKWHILKDRIPRVSRGQKQRRDEHLQHQLPLPSISLPLLRPGTIIQWVIQD